MSKKNKKNKEPKARNYLAVWAWEAFANSAGFHSGKGNKKKAQNKKACRKKVDY